MKYNVIIEPEAQDQVRESYQYIKADAPLNAERWLQGLFKAIDSLENLPKRCGEARENDRFNVHLRQLVYKSHRIIYTIDGNTVYVLTEECKSICTFFSQKSLFLLLMATLICATTFLLLNNGRHGARKELDL